MILGAAQALHAPARLSVLACSCSSHTPGAFVAAVLRYSEVPASCLQYVLLRGDNSQALGRALSTSTASAMPRSKPDIEPAQREHSSEAAPSSMNTIAHAQDPWAQVTMPHHASSQGRHRAAASSAPAASSQQHEDEDDEWGTMTPWRAVKNQLQQQRAQPQQQQEEPPAGAIRLEGSGESVAKLWQLMQQQLDMSGAADKALRRAPPSRARWQQGATTLLRAQIQQLLSFQGQLSERERELRQVRALVRRLEGELLLLQEQEQQQWGQEQEQGQGQGQEVQGQQQRPRAGGHDQLAIVSQMVNTAVRKRLKQLQEQQQWSPHRQAGTSAADPPADPLADPPPPAAAAATADTAAEPTPAAAPAGPRPGPPAQPYGLPFNLPQWARQRATMLRTMAAARLVGMCKDMGVPCGVKEGQEQGQGQLAAQLGAAAGYGCDGGDGGGGGVQEGEKQGSSSSSSSSRGGGSTSRSKGAGISRGTAGADDLQDEQEAGRDRDRDQFAGKPVLVRRLVEAEARRLVAGCGAELSEAQWAEVMRPLVPPPADKPSSRGRGKGKAGVGHAGS